MIGTGRVCGTSASSAPERDHHLDLEPLGDLEHAVGEGAPAQVRLDPGDQHQVALGGSATAARDRVRGPVDLARLALGHPDRRPGDLEVVELLRIDLGDRLGVERGGDRLERRGRGAGGVVPAGERGDQDRRAQLAAAPLPSSASSTSPSVPRGTPGHAGRVRAPRSRSTRGGSRRPDPSRRSPSCVPASASRAATPASRRSA